MKQFRKIAAWIVVVLVVVAGIALMARQQQAAAQKYEAERESRCTAAFPSPWDSEQQNACKHERDSGQNYLPWWYVLVAWPEGITTWAVLGTGFVIAWQSYETRKSAKAALLNAEYLVNLERPYLYLELEHGDALARDPDEEDIQWYDVRVVNRGHTIAEIVSASDPKLHLVEGRGAVHFPHLAVGEFRERTPPIPVLPGGGKPIDITQIYEDAVFRQCGSVEKQARFFKGESFMYATGVILFRDLLRPPTAKPHEMHWCCRVRHDGSRLVVYLDGPKEYNYQT